MANEQFERGEYFDAQKTYRKVYNKLTKREQRPQRGQVAYQMGLCYDKLGMSARASSAFANAIRYGYPDSTAMLLMGRSLQAEGKYAQAQKAYEDFLATGPKSPQEAETDWPDAVRFGAEGASDTLCCEKRQVAQFATRRFRPHVP